MLEHESLQPELGKRLRSLRRARGHTLTEVGKATSISASFLSLVESGKNDLAISRLIRLCEFYDVSLLEALPPVAEPDAAVLRHGHHAHVSSPGEGIRMVLLAPDANRLMLPVSIEFDPAGGFAEFSDYPGETFLVVVSGTVDAQMDDGEAMTLETGDSVYLKAGRRYRFRNGSQERPASAFAVVSPPRGAAAPDRRSAEQSQG